MDKDELPLPEEAPHGDRPTVPPCPAGREGGWSAAEPASVRHTSALQAPSTVPPADVVQNVAAPANLEVQGYEILGELGRGGMGVVYRARHLATGEVVALKTLQQLTPATLYRFKQEFRVVAGLAHPNLIPLRELVSNGASWFFTMELLDGVDLRTHVWGVAGKPHQGAGIQTAPLSPGELARLRTSLHQLAAGISALH